MASTFVKASVPSRGSVVSEDVAGSSVGASRDDEERRVDCICTHEKDQGKFSVTDSMFRFTSLHYNIAVPLADVVTAKKEGRKRVIVKTNKTSYIFGPFPAEVKRSFVLQALMSSAAPNAGEPSANGEVSVDVSKLPAQDSEDVTSILEYKAPGPPPEGIFVPIDTAKEKNVLNRVFSVQLKPLAYMLFSHESTFEKEINTIDGNENIEVSPWSLSPDKSFHVRVVKYMKRGIVNCVVTQTQRFKVVSPTEIAYETSSSMEGIPFTSPGQFTADSKWRLTEEDGGTRIQVWIRVEWHRKPPFGMQGKIDSGTVDGFTKFFSEYGHLIGRKLAAAGGKGADIDTEAGEKAATAAALGSGAAPIPVQNPVVMAIAAAALLFFLLFVYSWWSSSSWKAVALTLQDRNSVLHDQLANLKEELAALSRTRGARGPGALPSWQASLSEALQILQSLSHDMSLSSPSASGALGSGTAASSGSYTKSHRAHTDSTKTRDNFRDDDKPPPKRKPPPASVPATPAEADAPESPRAPPQEQQHSTSNTPSSPSSSASTSTNDSNGAGKKRPAKEKSKLLGNVADELEREVARLQQEMNQN